MRLACIFVPHNKTNAQDIRPARFCYCHITKDGNLLYERSLGKSRGTESSGEKDPSITEFSF